MPSFSCNGCRFLSQNTVLTRPSSKISRQFSSRPPLSPNYFRSLTFLASYHPLSTLPKLSKNYWQVRHFVSSRPIAQQLSPEDVQQDLEPYALPRSFLFTTPTPRGYDIVRHVGLVSGNTVRVRNAAVDYFAGIRAIFGGELTSYSALMTEARHEATKRMVDEAVRLGANAILNIRYSTSNLTANSSEVFCWGTAVVLR